MKPTLLLMTILLAGCATGPAPTIDTACDWVRPIWIHPADQLTPRTARQVLAHNETWQRICTPE